MKPYLPAVLALVVGGVLTLIAHGATRSWEEALEANIFEGEAAGHVASLRLGISSTIEVIHSIRSFYDASREVERAEFRAFVKREVAEQYHGIQALEWIPRVAAADRAVYFPVYFVEPLAGNEAALGFDLGSNPVRLAALNKARDSGETVVTARITLVQETGDQYGFLVFEPIYAKGAPADTVAQRRTALIGFGLGVLRLGDIVSRALSEKHREGVKHFLFDESAPSDEQLLFPKSSTVRNRTDVGLSGCVDNRMNVGGREWLMTECPVGGTAVIGSRQSWTVLAAGLMVTVTLALYLLVVQRHQARRERLREALHSSEARYRDLFNNAHDMIQSVDAEGRFVFVNQAWTEAMGYTLGDLANVKLLDLIAPETRDHCREAFKERSSGTSPLSGGIELLVYDDGGDGAARLLHVYPSGRSGDLARHRVTDDSALRVSRTFGVAGRNWTIVARPISPGYGRWPAWEPWAVLGAGLAFTILLVAYLVFSLNRARAVEDLVGRRTPELRRANDKAEQALRS